MHHIYQTDAFVLKTTDFGEANKLVKLLTKDFGLITTTAQGLRYEKSKLRFAIQDYSRANVSLVRGKNDIWRLTNAQSEKNLFSDLAEEKFKTVARVFRLLERLLSGEETDEELFQIIENGIEFFESEEIEKEKILDFESVFVLRILNHLGYIGNNKNINFYISDNKWGSEVIDQIQSERKNTLKIINEAIRQSQL